MTALPVGRCPQRECDAPVTLADLHAVDGGAPIWTCAEGHVGPTVIGPERPDFA